MNSARIFQRVFLSGHPRSAGFARQSLINRSWNCSNNNYVQKEGPSKLLAANAISARFYSGGKVPQNPPSGLSKWTGRYWRWKWVTVPGTVVTGLIIYENWRNYGKEQPEPAKNWQVAWYRFLPLKTLSRIWGWMHDLNLPNCCRSSVLSLYAKIFGCNISEAEVEDLNQYKNLGEFFRRPLKQGARPICDNEIVSPSDGCVLHFGRIKCGEIEQVKGVAYSLPEFLGVPTWADNNNNPISDIDPSNKSLLADCDKYSAFISEGKDTALYHLVVYLAPGDYHRFHSPTDWTMSFRRHFAGDLLSVNPRVAGWVPGLFNLNERAVYVGKWRYGFFSFVAIGATNVGSIRIYHDEELKTNTWKNRKGTKFELSFPQPKKVNKGELFGEFNLGSTIVLIFEAPQDVEFTVQPGERIFVGRPFLKLSGEDGRSENAKNNT